MARPFDSWRSISASLYMVLTGYAVLVGIPVISTAWVTQLHFSEVEVGRLAAADLGGLSLGAVLCSFLIVRHNRRYLVLGAALFAILANLGCVAVTDYALVVGLRLIAGVASGVYTAVAISSLSATSNPTRAYSWVLFAFALSQAIELYLLPQLSIGSIYLLFACSYALLVPFIRWLPADAPAEQGEGEARMRSIPAYVPWLVLGAVLFTYINIGAYWTYIELAAADSEVSAAWMGNILVGSALFSILGCLLSTVISSRFGLARPLVLTLMAQALVVLVLVGGIDAANILFSVCGFNLLWMMGDIYQISVVARVDPSGRFAALIPGAQGIGQIIGPNVAATTLGLSLGYSGVFVVCAIASLSAMGLYLVLIVQQRRAPLSIFTTPPASQQDQVARLSSSH